MPSSLHSLFLAGVLLASNQLSPVASTLDARFFALLKEYEDQSVQGIPEGEDARKAIHKEIIALGPEIKPLLLRILKTKADTKDRAFIVSLLGELKVSDATDVLVQCIENARPQSRDAFEAAAALSQIDTPESMGALLRELRSSHGVGIMLGDTDRNWIIRVHSSATVRIMKSFLAGLPKANFSDEAERMACDLICQALAKTGTTESLAVLAEQLRSDNDEQRKFAINALGASPARDAAAKLLESAFHHTNDADEKIVIAGNVLRCIRYEPVISFFKCEVFSCENSMRRRAVIEMLGKVDSAQFPESKNILRQLLFDADSDVNTEASEVLIRTGTDDRDFLVMELAAESWGWGKDEIKDYVMKARRERSATGGNR